MSTGSGTVGRSSTLPSLLSQFQIAESRRRATAFDPSRFVDPLDVGVDLLADTPGVESNSLSAAQVAYFLLRRLDDQLSGDGKRSVPRKAMPACFSILRRVIGHSSVFYEAAGASVPASALQLYALIVALRLLKTLVLQLPTGVEPDKLGFHVGVKAAEGEGALANANAKFVDQLNWILSCPASHAVAQLSVPVIHEIIAETLSQGVCVEVVAVCVFVTEIVSTTSACL